MPEWLSSRRSLSCLIAQCESPIKPVTSKPSESLTDWTRLRAMRDEDIDHSEIPPINPVVFARGIVREGLKVPAGKAQITLRLDRDVLAWFRASGAGFQSRINALLRAYMDAHRSVRE